MPFINVRWATNTDELKRNLAQGLQQIEATKTSVEKLVTSFKGEGLAIAAHKWAAAISEVGGVTKLTATEQERANAIFQKFIEKQQLLGQAIPPTIRSLADQTKALVDAAKAAEGHAKAVENAAKGHGQLFEAIRLNIPVVQGLSARFTESLGALGGGGVAIAGGAVAGGAFALLAKDALSYADALTKASDRTGIEVVALQRLNAIAQPSGNSLEDLAGAINKFQKNLADGDKDAAAALTRIGLSVQAVRALEPDQQFIAIAKGIQTIKDPAEQTLLAVQLFGKGGAEILPSLKARVDELANASVTMSREAVQALDDFGDGLARLKSNAVNIAGEILAAFLGAAKGIKHALDEAQKTAGGPAKTTTDLLRQQPQLASAKVGPPQPSSAVLEPLGFVGRAYGGVDLPNVASRNATAIASLTAVLRSQEAAADRLGISLEDYQKKLAEVGIAIDALRRGASGLSPTNQQAIVDYHELGLTAEQISIKLGIPQAAVDSFLKLDAATKEIALQTGAYGKVLDSIQPGIRTQAVELLKAGVAAESVRVKFELSAQQLKALEILRETDAKLLAAESIGAGDLASALEKVGKVDVETTARLKDRAKILEEIAKIENQPVGHIETSLLPGDRTNEIGDLKNLFERFAETHRFLSEQQQIAAQKTAILSGRFRELAGVLQQAAGLAGSFGTVIQATAAGVAAAAEILAGSYTAGFSYVLQLEADAEARNAAINAQLAQFNLTFRQLQQRAQEAGISMRDFQSALDGSDAALKHLQQAFQLQDEALAGFSEAVKKYKLSLKDLGPAGAFKELSDAAVKLYQDFKLLTGGGVDQDVVLKKMAKSLNDLVRNALASGAALPEFLRPMLQRLLELGLLTDGAGRKLSSLAGIQFSGTLSTQFETLIQKIEKLTLAIARAFGVALKGLGDLSGFRTPPPGTPTIGIGVPRPKGGASGGLVTSAGIAHFEAGGPFVPRGRDVIPAMLSEREVVLNENQQHAVGYLLSMGQQSLWRSITQPRITDTGPPVVHLHNDFRGAFVDREGYRRFARHVAPDIAEAIAQNKRGADGRTAGSRMRASLGLKS